jgi:hypothetical protein
VAAVALTATATAAGSTAPNFAVVSYDGDTLANYDTNSKVLDSKNVDWPVSLIFWGNATVAKVYNKIGWPWPGSNEYMRLNDGDGAVWVSSAGRKTGICGETHFRLYADSDGSLSSPVLGKYVIATAHLDKDECGRSPKYGWNETAEANVAARAIAVWGGAAVKKNARTMPDGTATSGLLHNAINQQQGNHYFVNNGHPTLIKVP